MNRLRHRLFNLLSWGTLIVSILALLAVSTGWVRSHFHYDSFIYHSTWSHVTDEGSMNIWLASGDGVARIAYDSSWRRHPLMQRTIVLNTGASDRDDRTWSHESWPIQASPGQNLGAGFSPGRPSTGSSFAGSRHVSYGLPYWAIALVTAIPGPPLITMRVRRYLRFRSRRLTGLCTVCGYDLRATPDRCPECGAIPEGAKGAAA
jgi:hypothetical protein